MSKYLEAIRIAQDFGLRLDQRSKLIKLEKLKGVVFVKSSYSNFTQLIHNLPFNFMSLAS